MHTIARGFWTVIGLMAFAVARLLEITAEPLFTFARWCTKYNEKYRVYSALEDTDGPPES